MADKTETERTDEAMTRAVIGRKCPVPECEGMILFARGCCAPIVFCDAHPMKHQRFATEKESARFPVSNV